MKQFADAALKLQCPPDVSGAELLHLSTFTRGRSA